MDTAPALTSLFIKYKEGTDKFILHGYTDLYGKLLEPIRSSAKNVLEIGVQSGASCVCWEEYFTVANIYGIDINLTSLKYGIGHDRINFKLLNGTDQRTPLLLNKRFDFILDDASHTKEDQIRSFELFSDFLTPEGIFICEDIFSFNLEAVHRGFEGICSTKGMECKVYDLRPTVPKHPFNNDIVIVATRV